MSDIYRETNIVMALNDLHDENSLYLCCKKQIQMHFFIPIENKSTQTLVL